jgi:uncharacterized protein (TIGR02271 family)
MSQQRDTAVGVFQDREAADRAVRDLKQAGFRDDQIGYTTPNQDEKRNDDAGTTGGYTSGGHVIGGAVAGGVLGGIAGAIAAGLIPGIGPLLAGGILAVTAAGAGLGAAGGSLIGALTSLGVPHDEAQYYEGEARSGRSLVTVKSGGRYDEARSILQGAGAYDMETRRPEFQSPQSQEGERMPLVAEKLAPRKETVESGQVKLRKEVVTEQRQMDVPVKHEEVVLERHPVEAREAQGASIGEGEVSVPVREEQVRVGKQSYVKEEVGIGKRQVEERQTITGDVRHEEPRIENSLGDNHQR